MEDEPRDTCFGAGSVAGAVIGTFLTTILLFVAAALLYRQWRRHKGKHLVLVTDPEIVEEAYAFDNPCFKDVTTSTSNRIREGEASAATGDTPAKDSVRWSTSWTTLGLGSANRNDKRRTLDDTCLGPRATKVSVVSLKSRDFTGLGFNICGNMREGIFVKDLLHRGPASESGRIHPGDRIASVKISFRNMVYEDALTILSYASPYDVKLEVESGGTESKPTTLLKKTVGPSVSRICHPLYRSQSIPELSQAKSVAKRLFIVDPNESISSNYSTMNSTLKSAKSTPVSNQTVERRQEKSKGQHYKFGIKVLPALDGTVHRIENQNEHNTNLERRHSKKMSTEKHLSDVNRAPSIKDTKEEAERQQNSQKLSGSVLKDDLLDGHSVDTLDNYAKDGCTTPQIPSEVPMEVHNAAMAARRNRKNSSGLLNVQKNAEFELEDSKNLQKNKRKAPQPPKTNSLEVEQAFPSKKDSRHGSKKEDDINSISDYAESLSDYVSKVRECTENMDLREEQRLESLIIDGRNSESDDDSEIQNSFTTIELNSADIMIHRTPVPETNDDENDEDDVYRKAASLGDLSKYECKTSTTLERAQSLDMTDTGTKKRKAPLPPEDITESTEDLTKLDQMDTFDKRLLKKSNEWGTLEDVVVWRKKQDSGSKSKKPRSRKMSNGSLERSKSAVEIKLKCEDSELGKEYTNDETSIELYNLPLSKKLTEEFIHSERMFNPDEDNSLARIVNDGNIVKSPTAEEVELEFKEGVSLPDYFNNDSMTMDEHFSDENEKMSSKEFEVYGEKAAKYDLLSFKNWKADNQLANDNGDVLYTGKSPIVEEPMRKITVKRECPACEENRDHHETCKKKAFSTKRSSTPISLQNYSAEDNDTSSITIQDEEKINSVSHAHRTVFKDRKSKNEASSIESKSPPRRAIEVSSNQRIEREDDEDEDEYEFGSGVTVNSKSTFEDRRNINNISVSSGENSEDSGLVGESMDYNTQEFDNRLTNTSTPQKMTYITEVKVSPYRGKFQEDCIESRETIPIIEDKGKKLMQDENRMTANGKTVSSKKPPVPPRRTDAMKSNKKNHADKQVIYVSEYKSNESKQSDSSNISQEVKQQFVEDTEQKRWERNSNQPHTVKNIVRSSREDNVLNQ